jgi:zinc protease
MLMRGTQQRSRQELRDELARLQAQANVGGGATAVSGALQTTRANLPAVLRLVGEVLRQPAFDATEFEQLRQQTLAAIEEQRSEPQMVASNALGRHMNTFPKGHPRYAATIEEEIEAVNSVTLAEVRSFYNDFYGAAAGDLTIVGDFDADEARRIAEEIFGGWNAVKPFTRVGARFHQPPAKNIALATPDKANAFFIAATNLDVTDEHPDYPALVIANYIMGGGVLNSRLATRIRQQDGLSYGVGTAFSAHPIDSGAGFLAFAIYAPENVVRLEAAFREEMERALTAGFNAEEVEAAKQGHLQSLQVARTQDGGLARALGTSTYFGRTLEWDAAFEDRIRALTAEQVSAAFRRHVDLGSVTIIKAGDFER